MIRRYIEPKIEEITEDFLDKYLINMHGVEARLLDALKNVFANIIKYTIEKDRERLAAGFEGLAMLSITIHTPYIVLVNEVSFLKNTLADILIENNAKEDVYELFSLYTNVESRIAQIYLDDYLKKLTRINTIRRNSLKDMIEKNIVNFYDDHLEWINGLVVAVEELDASRMPELDSFACSFGKWLNGDAKSIIKNNSKYKEICKTHNTLHELGTVIDKQLRKGRRDFNVLMSYIEKCEMISLAIGAELALIDNTLLIKKATKDEMTGALNRNSLSYIFINQYELSLATSTSFVLAMCDLDNFKQLNDTYGHVAGDMALKMFVQTAKSILRDSDVIIRYGGEEFAILLPNTNMINAEHKLEAVRAAFENSSCVFEGANISTTVSMGAVEITPDSDDNIQDIKVEHFVAIADKLLYESKIGGKNRLTFE
jgi:diguanylate cyclase (GGDEF)-like protein